MKIERNQSRFEVGRRTGLGDIESQRRLSDLFYDGKAIITGSRKHFQHEVSLYSVKEQLTLYPVEKPKKLGDWLLECHPDVFNEYQIYKQSFLL